MIRPHRYVGHRADETLDAGETHDPLRLLAKAIADRWVVLTIWDPDGYRVADLDSNYHQERNLP